MKSFAKRVFAHLSLGLAPALLLAQSGAPAAEEIRQAEVSVSYLGVELPPTFFVRDSEGEFDAVPVGRMRQGSHRKVPLEGDQLSLFREIRDPETHRLKKEVAISLAVPDEVTRFNLIFYRTADGKLQRTLITEDEAGQSAGSARLINLMGWPVYVEIGENRRELEAGSQATVSLDAARQTTDNRYYRVNYRYGYLTPEGKPDVTNKRRLRLRDDQYLVIFYTHLRGEEQIGEDETRSYIKPESVSFILTAPQAGR